MYELPKIGGMPHEKESIRLVYWARFGSSTVSFQISKNVADCFRFVFLRGASFEHAVNYSWAG